MTAQTDVMPNQSPLVDLFGANGVAVLAAYLQKTNSGGPRLNFEALIARERHAQATDAFAGYFGPHVTFDPKRKNEYGKKAKIARVEKSISEKKYAEPPSILRFPVVQPNRQILHMDDKPFDPATERPRQSTFRAVYTPENIIRHRIVDGKPQSNAQMVKWSNGDVTMHIGGDVYAVGRAANDPHVLFHPATFTQLNDVDSNDEVVNTALSGYQSAAPPQAPLTLRLATPLDASSPGQFLAREKLAKQKGSKLAHIPLQKKQAMPSRPSFASRQMHPRLEIVDSSEDLVIDVLAQQRAAAMVVSPGELEKEIRGLEVVADRLGVVDSASLVEGCRQLRELLRDGSNDAIRKGLEQCGRLRQMYGSL